MQCPYDTAKANYRHALLKLKARIEALELNDGMGSEMGWIENLSKAVPEVDV